MLSPNIWWSLPVSSCFCLVIPPTGWPEAYATRSDLQSARAGLEASLSSCRSELTANRSLAERWDDVYKYISLTLSFGTYTSLNKEGKTAVILKHNKWLYIYIYICVPIHTLYIFVGCPMGLILRDVCRIYGQWKEFSEICWYVQNMGVSTTLDSTIKYGKLVCNYQVRVLKQTIKKTVGTSSARNDVTYRT